MRKIVTGIDLGTYHTKVMVVEKTNEGQSGLKIIGAAVAETKGVRHGYIVNREETTKSIAQAVKQAERTSGVKIKNAFVSIGGIGLSGFTSSGLVVIPRPDSEITEMDVEKALEMSETSLPSSQTVNRSIIHRIPIQYKVDGKAIIGMKPARMKGSKLEARVLYVSCLEQHLEDLDHAVEDAGLEVIDEIASPLAASTVTLNKTQKIAGAVLANIGAETVSIVVFENGIPVSLEIFPIGSTDITHDIALGLKIPIDSAENAKKGSPSLDISRKKLDDIISARLSDIFDLIEAHLKKIGRNGLLPAGIIITGGGSRITSIEDLARVSLSLPSKVVSFNFGGNLRDTHDSVWAVAYGLCRIGASDEDALSGVEMLKKRSPKIISWLKQFIP